jgi:hypothetical protein
MPLLKVRAVGCWEGSLGYFLVDFGRGLLSEFIGDVGTKIECWNAFLTALLISVSFF